MPTLAPAAATPTRPQPATVGWHLEPEQLTATMMPTTRPTAAATAATATPPDLPECQREAATGCLSLEPPGTATPAARILGHSAGGLPIMAYNFGNGPQSIILVGGLHGGYEWNTILLAYEVKRYLEERPAAVPAGVAVWLVPSANPDGQVAVTGREGPFVPADVAADTFGGRFNSRGVDLNRNWNCRWQPSGLWRDQVVSGGSEAFSELESQALRDFILEQRPVVVLFWHSAANGVFASGCPEVHAPSRLLADIYGAASGYPVYDSFFAYPISGDAGDWLTTQAIASISIELTTHEALDWPQNLAGLTALLAHFDRPAR